MSSEYHHGAHCPSNEDSVKALIAENDALSERVTEVEAQLGVALNEYACFLETMTAINQHQGYQFTQPLMNAGDCLNRMREKYTGQGCPAELPPVGVAASEAGSVDGDGATESGNLAGNSPHLASPSPTAQVDRSERYIKAAALIQRWASEPSDYDELVDALLSGEGANDA